MVWRRIEVVLVVAMQAARLSPSRTPAAFLFASPITSSCIAAASVRILRDWPRPRPSMLVLATCLDVCRSFLCKDVSWEEYITRLLEACRRPVSLQDEEGIGDEEVQRLRRQLDAADPLALMMYYTFSRHVDEKINGKFRPRDAAGSLSTHARQNRRLRSRIHRLSQR